MERKAFYRLSLDDKRKYLVNWFMKIYQKMLDIEQQANSQKLTVQQGTGKNISKRHLTLVR
jgi:hypothetical protein